MDGATHGAQKKQLMRIPMGRAFYLQQPADKKLINEDSVRPGRNQSKIRKRSWTRSFIISRKPKQMAQPDEAEVLFFVEDMKGGFIYG